jgi:hypothetical protein
VEDLLNQAYDPYLRSLDDQLAGLGPQRTNQEQIVSNSYNQSVSDLGAQRTQGMADLATQRRKTEESATKNLKSLADNIRSQMMAGQVYLGARGAGDSSAANQWSYALTQLGNKNRGDILSQQQSIMSDIGDREARLGNIYTQEKSRLDTEKNNQLLQVAQWYESAKQQIQGLKGQAFLQKSQQLLNVGLNALNTIQQQVANRQSMLDQWAVNNSTNLNQLKANMQQVGGFQAPGIVSQNINTVPQGQVNSSGQFYPGSNTGNNEWWKQLRF